jgi:hypothetical protein
VTGSLIFASQELAESAKTAALSVTHAPIGKGGKNWITRTAPGNTGQLPAYIQNVRNGIMRGPPPVPEGEATEIAIGRVRDWAAGGGNVKPEVRAAARKAIAEYAALKGKNDASKAAGAVREHSTGGCTVPDVDPVTEMLFEDADTSALSTPSQRHRDGKFSNLRGRVTGNGKTFATMMDELKARGHVKNTPGKGAPEVTIGSSPDSGGASGWMYGTVPDTFATNVAYGGLGEADRRSDSEAFSGREVAAMYDSARGKGMNHTNAITHVAGRKRVDPARVRSAVSRFSKSKARLRESIDWDTVISEGHEAIASCEQAALAEVALAAAELAEALLQERAVPQSKREALLAKGQAVKNGDGSIAYPIENPKDLENAATLARSGHGNVPAAKRLIAKMAKKLGVKNPLQEADAPRLVAEPAIKKGDRVRVRSDVHLASLHQLRGRDGKVEEVRDIPMGGNGAAMRKLSVMFDNEDRVELNAAHVQRIPRADRVQKVSEADALLQEASLTAKLKRLRPGHDTKLGTYRIKGKVGGGYKLSHERTGEKVEDLGEHGTVSSVTKRIASHRKLHEALVELETLLEGDGPRDYGEDAWSGALPRAKSLNQGETMRFPDGTALKRHASADGRDQWSAGTPSTWREDGVSWNSPHRTPERAVQSAMEGSAASSDPESLGGSSSYYRGMSVDAKGNGLRFAGVSPTTGNALVSDPSTPSYRPQEVEWATLKPNSATTYLRQ